MNKPNFYDNQTVTPGEMNTFVADVEEAINRLSSKGVGQGWIWGAEVLPNEEDALSIDIAPFFGHAYPNGETIASMLTLVLKLSHVGQTPIGAAGEADGSLITVANNTRLWVSVAVKPVINYEDLRIVNPPTYWRQLESWRLVVAAGSAVSLPDFPDRPTMPAMTSYLFLADVLVKNEDGNIAVEMVDNSRRTPWTGGKQVISQVGFPAIMNYLKMRPFEDLAPGVSLDMTGIMTVENQLSYEWQGHLFWTKKGAFIQHRVLPGLVAAAGETLVLSLPILNIANSPVTRTITVKAVASEDVTNETDFLEFFFNAMGAPFSEDGGWNNLEDGNHIFAGTNDAYPYVQSHDQEITLTPGRNLLRLFFRHMAGDTLTACITSEFLNHESLRIDRELLMGLLHNADYKIFLGETA